MVNGVLVGADNQTTEDELVPWMRAMNESLSPRVKRIAAQSHQLVRIELANRAYEFEQNVADLLQVV